MLSMETAIVKKISWSRPGLQCLEVSLGDKIERALNYPSLAGTALPGHRVALNTTAVRLGLGSGGYHFVIYNHSRDCLLPGCEGHILKLRYTPQQLKVKTYEEMLGSGKRALSFEKYPGLQRAPVILGELHSMLEPFIRVVKHLNPSRKIAYIMTDSASLPLQLSETVHRLKEEKLLEGALSCGHAFGGDLETVNIYTALIAAREKLKAEVIVVTPGPGVVGTATRYGFSSIELGDNIDRVRKMKGTPVVIPRLGFFDGRPRHYGLSHHTLTTLGEIAAMPAYLPLPSLDRKKMLLVWKQMKEARLLEKHRVVVIKRKNIFKGLQCFCHQFLTMGRGVKEEPAFFSAVASAAYFTEKMLCRSYYP